MKIITGQRIEPFSALLYNPQNSGPLNTVVAPPYDLIGPDLQAELYARSPNNVVRIELNRDSDRYESSARTLNQWIDSGVLQRRPRPAIYLYTQTFTVNGHSLDRHGFVVRIRLEDFSGGRILPHERTFPAHKKDRLQLLEATETNVSSIFGLYSGAHPDVDNLRETVLSRPALIDVTDDLGIRNQVRAIENSDEIATIQQALASPRILIADGHHRYETALEYRRRKSIGTSEAREAEPFDYTMMTLTALNDPGLVILPTHRVVHRLGRGMEKFAEAANECFTVRQVNSGDELRAGLSKSNGGALGVALKGGPRMYLLQLRDRAAMIPAMPDASAEVRDLDVAVLHALVLDRIFGLSPEEIRAGGNIEYTIDAHSALDAVASRKADGAFLMNPPKITEVERVSGSGATMPEKSTYFFPKLLTGLLMNPLRD